MNEKMEMFSAFDGALTIHVMGEDAPEVAARIKEHLRAATEASAGGFGRVAAIPVLSAHESFPLGASNVLLYGG